MVDVARARKLAVRIREVVASTLELQVKDPRLGMVTITDAKVHEQAERAAPAGDPDPYKAPRVIDEEDRDDDG